MLWSHQYLSRMDFRAIPVILGLMVISLLVISSNSVPSSLDPSQASFFTPQTRIQMLWFTAGWGVYLFCAGFDYSKIREWAWFLYILILIALVGVFLTPSIQHVHRWYRIPGTGIGIQPSEGAKIGVVIVLSWFLERRADRSREWGTIFWSGLIVGIPFLLILKQPDLGSALVLYPISLVMFYFGDVHPYVTRSMCFLGMLPLMVVLLIFTGAVSHEDVRPYATKVLKEYQYNRLDPNTRHQKAALNAIALGGLTGSGWRHSEFTGRGWLPAPYTDSVYASFGEEFGFVGLLTLMGLFYSLIYFGFQVSAAAKDHFGCLLAAGLTVFLAIHVLMNVGVMCGFLPITGIPLVLVTYGGSSTLSVMAALGIMQSVYSRRFMF